MISSCFICGVNIVSRFGHDSRKKNSFEKDLAQLIRRLYELLKLANRTENNADGWDVFTSLQQQSICCVKCYNILKNVERVHEIILKTEKQLKTCLDQVQALVVESDKLEGVTATNDHFEENLPSAKVKIKSEVSAASYGEVNFVEGLFDEADDQDDNSWDNITRTIDDYGNESEKLVSSENALSVITTLDGIQSEKVISSPAKRRKVRVLCEEDDEEASCSINLESRIRISTTGRAAKNNAKKSLKQYALISKATSDSEKEDAECLFSVSTEVNDREGTNNEDSNSCMEGGHQKLKKRGKKQKRDDEEAIEQNTKGLFYPFLSADENLYLYRFTTFVRKTNTHLVCLASNCSFTTEWDYYASFQKIKSHIESKHRSKYYLEKQSHPCVICNIKYGNRKEIRNHLKEKHKQLFTQGTGAVCECCLMVAPNFHIELHMFSHKNEEEKAVARSAKDAAAQSSKERKKHEPKDKEFRCVFEGCGRIFSLRGNLVRHERTHLPPDQRTDIIPCPKCGKMIGKESLSAHIVRVHHPEFHDQDKLLICPYCNKRYMSKDKALYQSHLNRHRGERPFACSLCSLAYTDKAGLQAHIKIKHTTKDPIHCQWCDKVFTIEGSYRKHLGIHHRDKITLRKSSKSMSKFYNPKKEDEEEVDSVYRYKCKFEGCNKAFKYWKSWDRHKQTHLSIEKRTDQTVCPECGVRVVKDAIKQHMLRVHHPEMAEKVLVCEFCDKRFLTSDNAKFQVHLRRHRGEKPFLCTQCGLAFVSNTSLKGHIKQVHGDDEEISCKWCDKVYTKISSLQSHIAVHHPDEWSKKKRILSTSKFYDNKVIGEVYGPIQKFPCPICDTLCGYNDSLKRHMKRKHNIGKEPSTKKKPERPTTGNGSRSTTKIRSSESDDADDETVEDFKSSSESGLHGYGIYYH